MIMWALTSEFRQLLIAFRFKVQYLSQNLVQLSNGGFHMTVLVGKLGLVPNSYTLVFNQCKCQNKNLSGNPIHFFSIFLVTEVGYRMTIII